MAELTFAEVDALLKYDPETGKLFWKVRTPDMFVGAKNPEKACAIWNVRKSGKEAFTAKTKQGAMRGNVSGFNVKAHRVCWILYYGEWPKDNIDHINGDPSDNRIVNMRDVTQSENQKNVKGRKGKNGAISGVTFDTAREKWLVQITVNGKTKTLGRFDDLEIANSIRLKFQEKHGFSERHGRRD